MVKRGKYLWPVHVVRDRSAGIDERRGIVLGQIGLIFVQLLAVVRGLPQMLRRCIQNVGIEIVEDIDRSIASARQGRRVLAEEKARIRLDVAAVIMAVKTREQCAWLPA